MLHDIEHVAVDVIVEGQLIVGIRWHAPVDQVGIKSRLYKMAHDALVFLEIQNVGPVYQRKNKYQRRSAGQWLGRFITQKLQPVLLVHHLGWRRALFYALGVRHQKW